MGNSLLQYRVVIGLHNLYLKARECKECFKGKFWSSLVLLFYMEAIYLSVLKTLAGKWLKFSRTMIDGKKPENSCAIYLNHSNTIHYDVVQDVCVTDLKHQVSQNSKSNNV